MKWPGLYREKDTVEIPNPRRPGEWILGFVEGFVGTNKRPRVAYMRSIREGVIERAVVDVQRAKDIRKVGGKP